MIWVAITIVRIIATMMQLQKLTFRIIYAAGMAAVRCIVLQFLFILCMFNCIPSVNYPVSYITKSPLELFSFQLIKWCTRITHIPNYCSLNMKTCQRLCCTISHSLSYLCESLQLVDLILWTQFELISYLGCNGNLKIIASTHLYQRLLRVDRNERFSI